MSIIEINKMLIVTIKYCLRNGPGINKYANIVPNQFVFLHNFKLYNIIDIKEFELIYFKFYFVRKFKKVIIQTF